MGILEEEEEGCEQEEGAGLEDGWGLGIGDRVFTMATHTKELSYRGEELDRLVPTVLHADGPRCHGLQ